MRKRLIFILAGILFVGVLFFLCNRPSSNSEASLFAEVYWKTNGKPLQIDLQVVDLKSNIVPSAIIRCWNNSGYQQAITDASGQVHLKMGEPEIAKIEVNGNSVLDRPAFGVSHTLWITNGLEVRIVLKK